MAVNTAVYAGDINTCAICLDPPAELEGKINVTPEMNDVVALATMYVGGEPCTEDTEVLKKVRDVLLAAKPNWMSMDYGMTEKMANNDVMASVYWNGAILRVAAGEPRCELRLSEGRLPAVDGPGDAADGRAERRRRLQVPDFIMVPENAAMISAFARYANGIAGSDAFMPADMKDAPEIVIPAEFKDKGHVPADLHRARRRNTSPRSGPNCRSKRRGLTPRREAGGSAPRTPRDICDQKMNGRSGP